MYCGGAASWASRILRLKGRGYGVEELNMFSKFNVGPCFVLLDEALLRMFQGGYAAGAYGLHGAVLHSRGVGLGA